MVILRRACAGGRRWPALLAGAAVLLATAIACQSVHRAVVVLPETAHRGITERAATIGATVEILAGGSELRLVVPADHGGETGAVA